MAQWGKQGRLDFGGDISPTVENMGSPIRQDLFGRFARLGYGDTICVVEITNLSRGYGRLAVLTVKHCLRKSSGCARDLTELARFEFPPLRKGPGSGNLLLRLYVRSGMTPQREVSVPSIHGVLGVRKLKSSGPLGDILAHQLRATCRKPAPIHSMEGIAYRTSCCHL